MTISTLVAWRREEEFFGRTLPVVEVQIDGRLASATAAPFSASQAAVHLHVCKHCYSASAGTFPSCSEAEVAVRRRDDDVYWFAIGHNPLLPGDSLGRVFTFSRAHYEGQLGGSAGQLPAFSRDEIRLLVNRSAFHPAERALYTDPEEPDDFHGRKLLASLARLLAAEDLEICCEPQQMRTVRIGIEVPGVPEVVVQLGACAGRAAVRFIAHPNLPWWLTSGQAASVSEPQH